MSKESVRITCKGATEMPVKQLEHFQGNLKSLSEVDYNRLKKEILELGFTEPVSAWLKNGKYFILNGHQRVRTLTKMVSEGYEVPNIPINLLEAKDANEARRKVLALTSQYGRMEKQGLYEFLAGSDIAPEELYESYRFAEIDIPKFTEEYYVDPTLEDEGDMGVVDQTYEPIGDAKDGESSNVKMVQLFLTMETFPRFKEMVEKLGTEYKIDNMTDTVYKLVEEAYGNLPN